MDGPGIVHYNEYRRLEAVELETVVNEYDKADKNMGVTFYKRDTAQTYSRYLDWFYRVWCKPNSEFRTIPIYKFYPVFLLLHPCQEEHTLNTRLLCIIDFQLDNVLVTTGIYVLIYP